MLTWSDEYSVGVQEIDTQHHRMLDYINELEGALGGENAREHMVNVLNGLVAYTKEHFTTEEKYFRMFDYKETDAHIAEHLNLIEDVEVFIFRLETGAELTPATMLDFLKTWLIEHILGADKRYMECFHKNGLA